MIKHSYIQRSQSKCNFCFQWFQCLNPIKNCLHLCESCLDQALNTRCYRVPSSDGKYWYQLSLFKNNLNMEQTAPNQERSEAERNRDTLLEDIDQLRDREMRKMVAKWKQVSDKISQMSGMSDQELKHSYALFEKYLDDRMKRQEQLIEKFINITELKGQKKVKQDERLNSEYFDRLPLSTINLGQRKIISNISKTENKEKVERVTKKKVNNFTSNFCSPTKRFAQKQSRINKRTRTQAFDQNQPSTPGQNCFFQNVSLVRSFQGKQKMASLSHIPVRLGEKRQFFKLNQQKRAKDLEAIANDALKSKIYQHLETESSVSPALFLVMTLRVYDAIKNTANINKCIELVSFNISDIDLKCYLTMLNWNFVEVLKLVKVGLTDEQFCVLLDFLGDKKVEAVVVSSNNLTETSCLSIVQKNFQSLKSLYMGRNRIQKNKIREQIRMLQSTYTLYL